MLWNYIKQGTHLGEDVTTTRASFSPDARSIAFGKTLPNGDVSRSTDLFIVDRDGANLRQLTTAPEPDRGPDWTTSS